MVPQLGEQSASVVASQPPAQQPSLVREQVVIVVREQATLHVDGEPVVVSTVHAFASSHEVGHVPEGSHVSPGSITVLPHVAVQSL